MISRKLQLTTNKSSHCSLNVMRSSGTKFFALNINLMTQYVLNREPKQKYWHKIKSCTRRQPSLFWLEKQFNWFSSEKQDDASLDCLS